MRGCHAKMKASAGTSCYRGELCSVTLCCELENVILNALSHLIQLQILYKPFGFQCVYLGKYTDQLQPPQPSTASTVFIKALKFPCNT